MVYLDWAAAALPLSLNNRFKDINNLQLSNPHSFHTFGLNSKQVEQDCKNWLYSYFNLSEKDYSILFNSGATEGCKWLSQYVSHFIHTLSNHTSVLGIGNCAYSSTVVDKNGNILNERINNNGNKEGITLFACPYECNFSGQLYNISFLKNKYNQAFFLLDAAKFVSNQTNCDLSSILPDFITISFYKMIGYPTGVGALIIKNTTLKIINKSGYAGGGTYDYFIPLNGTYKYKDNLDQFIDGTPNYYGIASSYLGLKQFSSIDINNAKMCLKYVYTTCKTFKANDNSPLIEWYGIDQIENHGTILSFNFKINEKDFIGVSIINHLANQYNIQLRTGCFCNPGACSYFLNHTLQDQIDSISVGNKCHSKKDFIHNKPTGAIRISFGHSTTLKDCDLFIQFCKLFSKTPLFQPIISNSKKVSKLILYPIKSGPGISCKQLKCNEYGFLYDRKFALFNKNKEYINLRTYSFYHTLSFSHIKDNIYKLTAKDIKEACIIDLDCSNCEELSHWFSQLMNEPIICKESSNYNFCQSSPFLLCNTSSLEDLNIRIFSNHKLTSFSTLLYKPLLYWIYMYGYSKIDMDYFRPNIIIEGLNPYEENTIDTCLINNITFKATNQKNKKQLIYKSIQNEPYKTLCTYRTTNQILFGTYLQSTDKEGIISVDDKIEIKSII